MRRSARWYDNGNQEQHNWFPFWGYRWTDKKGLPRPAGQFSDCSFLEFTERAMGPEPRTSSLGSGTKLRGVLRNALRINAVRPACFSTR